MSVMTLRCTGRAVNDNLQPYGPECGRRLTRWPAATDSEYLTYARAAGWAVGPNGDATCSACRRTDPQVARDCAELRHSLPGGVL